MYVHIPPACLFVCLSAPRAAHASLLSHCREREGCQAFVSTVQQGSSRRSTNLPGFLPLQTKPFTLLSVQLKTAARSGLLPLQDSFRLCACFVCVFGKVGKSRTHGCLRFQVVASEGKKSAYFPDAPCVCVCVCICVSVFSMKFQIDVMK